MMTYPIPRLPVLDWETFTGAKSSTTPCLLTHPNIRFTNSGRAAILLALEVLEIVPGDKVLVPTYHCPTMVAPIVARGAQAIFYPLDGNGAPRLAWIKQQDLQDVRAILVAHFFGLPQQLAEIRSWCDLQEIRLIEDCAHALFGAGNERPIGHWGDLAIASLTKFLPVPEGGCLVGNGVHRSAPSLLGPSLVSQIKAGLDIVHNGVTHDRLKGLRTSVKCFYGFLDRLKPKSQIAEVPINAPVANGFEIDVEQAHRSLTYASRWMAQHAPRERIVAARRANYEFLSAALAGIPGFRPLHPRLPESCAPYVFPLWVDQPDPGYAELRRLEFPVSRWDRLWPSVSTIPEDVGIQWSHHILQLACHQDLTHIELQQMVERLKQVYGPARSQL